jgi:hypothetical protein
MGVQGRLVSSGRPCAVVLSPAPDVQHAFAKAADELIRYVRRQNLAEIIKRPAHHGRKLVCRRMLCPAATQLQTSLPIRRCVHSPGLSPRPWPRRSGCRAGACTFPPILEAWGLERIGKATADKQIRSLWLVHFVPMAGRKALSG